MAPSTVYKIITERVLHQLEQGVIPWRLPWDAGTDSPANLVSGRPYTGINTFLLLAGGLEFTSRYWLSYRQVIELGGRIRPVEKKKSTIIVYFKMVAKQKEASEEQPSLIPLIRYYRVWNLDQTEGVDSPKGREPSKVPPTAPLTRAEQVARGYQGAPKVIEAGTEAMYVPSKDVIRIPPRNTFDSLEAFYATLFHEFGHSTGTKHRLDRLSREHGELSLGVHSYGFEELVAEMTAAFLQAEAGISYQRTDENIAAYINHWTSTLRGDVKLVVHAASKAEKAANWVLGRCTGIQ